MAQGVYLMGGNGTIEVISIMGRIREEYSWPENAVMHRRNIMNLTGRCIKVPLACMGEWIWQNINHPHNDCSLNGAEAV